MLMHVLTEQRQQIEYLSSRIQPAQPFFAPPPVLTVPTMPARTQTAQSVPTRAPLRSSSISADALLPPAA